MSDFDETSPLGLGFEDTFDDLPDFDEVVTDLPELPPTPPPQPSNGRVLTCEEGGHEFVHVGRGRAPKRCPEHKTRTSTSKPRRTSNVSGDRVQRLQDDLTKEIVKFGMGLSMVMPTAGVVLGQRAERTAAAFARIAESSPKMLEIMETATRALPALDLAETAVMFGTAIMVDTKRMSPDAFLPNITGVSAVWHDLNGSSSIQPENEINYGMPAQHVPPRFETITP